MIPKLEFGRTGHASTRVIFGGYALSQATQKEADHILEVLLEYGVNHIDTAPMYGNAEKRIGAWMGKHREDFFLATKTRKRGYKEAWQDLQKSLDVLKVDYVDLWQMHGLTNPVGWEKAMGENGALQAFIEARDKGLVRFLGVTGHGNHVAQMHRQSLERFDFDSVMLLYSYRQMQIPRYASDFEALAGLCRERKVGIQTIESIARGPLGNGPRTHNLFFYEPLVAQDAIEKSVHWALGLEDSFVITAGDMQFVRVMLESASRYEKRPSEAEMQALVKEYDIQPVFS